MLDADSISTVLDVYRPERDQLLQTLAALDDKQWARPTECPAYDVKGIATHLLGDDLSLLSRQRDGAENGLVLLAEELPGASFQDLLDSFNDRWVASAKFLSPQLLIELLRLTGEWTATYYQGSDPEAPGEYVGFFGGSGPTSPFWHAIAREYLERWVHHSQIRRALELGPLAERQLLSVGVGVVSTIARKEAAVPKQGDPWSLGDVVLGDDTQAANILTRGHTQTEIEAMVSGPSEAVKQLAAIAGRP